MSVGDALAEARGIAGLSVDEVSERTAIREIVIRSIERDDFDSLGGDLYVRGYLRKIAGAVGIDPRPLIREFDATRSNGSGGWPELATPAAPAAPAAPATPAATTAVADPVAAQAADSSAREISEDAAETGSDSAAGTGEAPAGPEPAIARGGAAQPGTEAPVSIDWPQAEDDAWDSGSATESAWTESEPVTESASGLPADSVASADSTVSAGSASSEDSWSEQGWTEPVAAEAVWAEPSRNAPVAPAVPATRPARPPVKPRRTQPRTRVRGWRWVLTISGLTVVVLAIVGVAAGEIVSKVGSTKSASAAAAPTHVPTVAPSASASPVTPAVAASTPASKPTPTATARPPAPIQRLPIQADGAFGPDGLADGDNPQSASFAISSNAPAPWQTNWYASADFGLLKHGTGLLLDMGKRVTITSVTIQLGNDWGAALQLRAGDEADLSQMAVVSHATDAGGQLTLRLSQPARARYVLIWFVKLPPSGNGTYTGSVYSVTVKGRP